MPKKYSEKLPRNVRGRGFCVAMDQDGLRCDNPATLEGAYHGADHEKARWVAVYLCDFHGDIERKEIEGRLPWKKWSKKRKAGKLMFPKATSY